MLPAEMLLTETLRRQKFCTGRKLPMAEMLLAEHCAGRNTVVAEILMADRCVVRPLRTTKRLLQQIENDGTAI